MPITSIWLSLLVEEVTPSSTALDYAFNLAAASEAHLQAIVGTPLFPAAGSLLLPEIGGLVDEANASRRNRAEQLAEILRSRATDERISADIEIIAEPYYLLRDHLVEAGRLADLVVIPRSAPISGLERDLVEEMLFSSGRPILLLPSACAPLATLDNACLAWDGSGRAARASGDARALLPRDTRIDVACVSSDRNASKRLGGSDISRTLARHFYNVGVSSIAADDRTVSEALLAYAKDTGASLLIMGGYGHSRLRETILGGVTLDMMSEAPLPVLMSYL